MKKIAVCVPTYNEADIIKKTVKKIDKGLSKYTYKYDTYIVNCDNKSIDGTGKIFQNVKTVSKKVYIGTNEIGKGVNLINFFEFCNNQKIDYAITIDADVISMDETWIDLFLNKLIKENVNYVVPSYKRSRFEGSTTNQFAYPLIYGLTGKNIRQPIGGDFAFDKTYINYIIKQPYNEKIKKYGIDIFMTLNAIYGNFNIKSINLGKKVHKPSFNKMYNMFGEVLEAAIYTVKNQKVILLRGKEENEYNINLIKSRSFLHKERANDLLEKSYNKLISKDKKYLRNIGYNGEKVIDDEEWKNIMYNILNKLIKNEEIKERELIDFVDIFVIRAVSYWNRVENISANDSEKIITNLVKNLRKEILEI